jgi:hypothetical protein
MEFPSIVASNLTVPQSTTGHSSRKSGGPYRGLPFADTLPISDGKMETGTNVFLDQLQTAMKELFPSQGHRPRESKLSLSEK